MMDTNTVSYIARNRSPRARALFKEAERQSPVCLSVITEAEILFGLAKRPDAHQAEHSMRVTLEGLIVLPWTSDAAAVYAKLRALNEKLGIAVGALDMLIAAHALSENATLVTNDVALTKLAGGPATVNWADDIRPN